MQKLFYKILVVLLFLSTSVFPQEIRELKILVKTNYLPPDSGVYVAGNNLQMGDWNPSKVKLEKISDSLWTKTFNYNRNTFVEFKITLGSWPEERLNDNGTIPSNTSFTILDDTTIIFNVSKWGHQNENKIIAHGGVTGKVEYIKGVKGEGILPRDVIVWLPPGYNKSSKKKYPVLYMHDGQNIIDPATSSFGYDWQIDEAADSLITAGKIKKIIIVGIYNTVDRSEEYSPGIKGYAYEKFIINKLKPMIDKRYNTLRNPENTAVAGSSMGGLISLMLVWEHPNVFSKAACLSPAFHIGDYDYVKTVKNYKGKKKPIKIYVDLGGIDLEKRLQPGVEEMLSLLKEKGYVEGRDLEYFKDPEAEHNEQAWAKRNWRWLEYFFSK